MEIFKTFSSTIAKLPVQDVDTDLIIPAQYLTSISKSGYGENLFRRLRDSDSNFCLNKDPKRVSKILVAKSNFGCGSSREHAVWALTGWGFKVVIAESFADIFSGNSAKNGLLLIVLPKEQIDTIFNLQEDETITVNLEDQTVTLNDGRQFNFEYEPFKKYCLINGIDELTYLLSNEQILRKHFSQSKIQSFQVSVE